MSVWSVNIFESFIGSLDFIDHNKLAVLMAPQPVEETLSEVLVNKNYLIIKIKKGSEKSLAFFKPNNYVFSRPLDDLHKYSVWVSYLREKVPQEVTFGERVLSSLITEDVEELFLLSGVQAWELAVAYKTLEVFKSLKGSVGRAEALIVIDSELTLINRFNLVTFLAKILNERLVNRVSLLRIDRFYKYLSSQEVEELLRWALRLYSEYLGREILLTDTREIGQHLYFMSLLSLEGASLLIKNLAGASQLAKFLTWGTTFTGSMGYAYLEGNAELLNQININDMVRACGWRVHKIFIPKTVTEDYIRIFISESSDDLMMRLSREIWDVLSILSEEEKDFRVLILMKSTEEFLSTIGGRS
ncbi:MAG: hypothetical protein QN229_05045 [Desulfurococcaceae archaeon TW002]